MPDNLTVATVQPETELSPERKIQEQPPSPPKREQWGGQFEFLLACLGNAVGLGNCWRFPYLCYKNGGGAFLFPYMICCLIIGLPLFLIELSFGQFSAMGPAHLWANLSPIFKGVGMASVISAMIVPVYYNMIIAWTLIYFVESLIGQNWQKCGHVYNTENCRTIDNVTSYKSSIGGGVSSTEEFFNHYVLTKSQGIDDINFLNWKLVAALFAAWIIVVLALIKGIQTSGKVVYFTATFPYVVLTILLARGITLPGSWDGILYLFTPNWNRITDIFVWRDAAVQVFYSFGVGSGGMITYASYNNFHSPVIKHALLVGVGDFLTSIFCSAVIFSMIGYMSTVTAKPIESIVQSGMGLAFTVIPEGLSTMPISALWSVLFFTMLFTLGIDSQFAMVETVTTFIFDSIRSNVKKPNKPLVMSICGIIWFLAGLPLCTDAGSYILSLMDRYTAGIPCLIVGLCEIAILVIYGVDRFLENINHMTKWKPPVLLKSHLIVMMVTVCPAVICIILFNEVAELFSMKTHFTDGDYQYPLWASWIGWGLVSVSILAVPFGMVHQIGVTLFSSNKLVSLAKRLPLLYKPTDLWWMNSYSNIESKQFSLPMVVIEDKSQTESAFGDSFVESNSHN